MKKELRILVILIAVLLVGTVGYYFMPKKFGKNVNPSEVDHINVFDGNTGTGFTICNLRRASATDALTSGRLAEQNGRPPDNPNSVLQLDHHDIMLGDPLEDCVSRYCIVHDHGLPFVWFPLGTDDRAP